MLVARILPLLCGLAVAQKDGDFGRSRWNILAPVEGDVKSSSPCYDHEGNAQKCVPEFRNAAFNVLVEATNTCGESRPQEYCLQTRGYGSYKACELCDVAVPYLSHSPVYLTDFNNRDNLTWWQSETMYEGIQYPNQVNLTLRFGKTFDITYVLLSFRSPRPESFSIFKRTLEDDEWSPYQHYSASCRDTYGLPDSKYIPSDDETRALCTSEESDISPLTGGSVAFSTLEGRPSSLKFDYSSELQDFVTATSIRVVLDRLNTFRDEVFGDPKVLKSYFYAIHDIAVGGRCKCNGHASQCVESTGGPSLVLVCRCEHNTMGADCEQCQPFYNDAPWRRATGDDAHECKPCNCNGYSTRCYFDQDLYDRTGHGGHCLDCAGNRDGPNCERCRDNYFEREEGICVPCRCNEIGSRSLQCNSKGLCPCKPGVTGDKCDRCEENYYDFGPQGCKPCGCSIAGSHDNIASCDTTFGVCACKRHVEGQTCDTCKPGYFNLDFENEFGCTPCFCFGHSSICSSAVSYSRGTIESSFVRGEERWKGNAESGLGVPVAYNAVTQSLGLSAPDREKVYFVAPGRFLGDQRGSYNHHIKFKLQIGELGPQASTEDIILEGSGFTISAPIFAEGNALPTTQKQEYSFRLHEDVKFGWSPRLSARDFMSLLSNLTAIKIRGTFTSQGRGFIDDVRLETARRGIFGDPATWVEMCTCPEGYIGQFCESCAPAYRHSPASGGPFAACIPCDCNNHAGICDSETGRCMCQHNTAGDQCQRCAKGYYGNALKGNSNDCQKCPCPNDGACIQLPDDTVVCLECPPGYAGPRCDLCTDGFFGDPKGRYGTPRPCEKCDCNGNVDPNAVANCNRTTGECLKCIYNTGGFYCDQCLPGFYGDALALPKGDCKPCRCNYYGTQSEQYGPPVCDQVSGQCQCKPHVTGLKCELCEEGYWNLTSGTGCESCDCDPTGAVNGTCDPVTGQCFCLDGVMGRKCDACEPYHYGFSKEGCKPCECDVTGSYSLQCDATGQCSCRENVEGRRCDRCRENTHDRHAGCRDCPSCYTLVLDAVSVHRERLAELERLLADVVSNPTVLNDESFDRTLNLILKTVEDLWNDAKAAAASGGVKTVEDHLNELKMKIENVNDLLGKIESYIEDGADFADVSRRDVAETEEIIKRARESLRGAQVYLDVQGTEALKKANERSSQFGKQSARMSDIAREARKLADKQDEETSQIEQTAYEARNTSNEAYNVARSAIDNQLNITRNIKGLMNSASELSLLHSETLQLANESLGVATQVYSESLAINTDASTIAIPAIDIASLREEVTDMQKEAQRIKEQVSGLMVDKDALLKEIEGEVQATRGLLDEGLEQQQVTSSLLADVFKAKAEAEEAVRKADDTLSEADNTLRTLEGFDKQVQESRDKAESALVSIKDIEMLIGQAEARTKDADEALHGADDDASSARDIAVDAQKSAESASSQAHEVRSKADSTKTDASRLKDEADDLAAMVVETKGRVSQHEETGKQDKNLVMEAQERANQAKAKAELASNEVQKALLVVTRILEILERAEKLDPLELDRLEKMLNSAHILYDESGIEESENELMEARNWQNRLIINYEEEIRKLRLEVDNIEEIKLSLPDGCFRQTKLEP